MRREIQKTSTGAAGHIPVMLPEVLESLAPKDDGVYVDGTFGAGGYTRAILNHADCQVFAIDRDPDAHQRAEHLSDEYPSRLHAIEGCFGDMETLLAAHDITTVDGIVLDIGVSSMQLDKAERGFSFQNDGPLDMRMSKSGLSAADVVNSFSESEIADILYQLGDERASRAIAKKIVVARTEKPFVTTGDLAAVIHSVVPNHGGLKTDSATKSFQALRIFVNDELGELDKALLAAEKLLKAGGRLVIVSFHSLEDSRVKNFLKIRSGRGGNASRHLPMQADTREPSFTLEVNNGLKASTAETAINPRARSATLRYAIRTAAPIWPDDQAGGTYA